MDTTSDADAAQPGEVTQLEAPYTARMPPMLYGTAWKEDRTADLVYNAIKAGFRGIDTSADTKHYNEAGTGEGIRRAIREGLVKRSDLWIQTKYPPGSNPPYSTYKSGPLPQITPEDIQAQILASVKRSLAQLHPDVSPASSNPSNPPSNTSSSSPSNTSSHPPSSSAEEEEEEPYLDALLLHTPYPSPRLTHLAYTYLRTLTPHPIRTLGICNIRYDHLSAILPSPYPPNPPLTIQNRFCKPSARKGFDPATCNPSSSFDIDIRQWVASRPGTKYQGFWTLTANKDEWETKGYVGEIAEGSGVERAVVWYALLGEAGVVVLNGTGKEERMRGDLEGLRRVGEWRGTERGAEVWERGWREFCGVVHDVEVEREEEDEGQGQEGEGGRG